MALTSRPSLGYRMAIPGNSPHAVLGSRWEVQDAAFEKLRRSQSTGRPVGAEEFVLGLEKILKRPIARRSPGRKPSASVEREQFSLLS
jgi:hypothetical protein